MEKPITTLFLSMPVDDIKIVPITFEDFQFGYDIRKLTME
jgi:hypothetical protein